jgi:hypothetical protein
MDRNRFQKRVRELGESAKLVENLTKMPDRTTEKDFRRIVDLLKGAAEDVEALLRADLPGCSCRRIDHDDYSYLDYSESCQHHARLFAREKAHKAHYEAAEKKLKDEVRMRLVASALSGTAGDLSSGVAAHGQIEVIVENAIQIADRTIQAITTGAT